MKQLQPEVFAKTTSLPTAIIAPGPRNADIVFQKGVSAPVVTGTVPNASGNEFSVTGLIQGPSSRSGSGSYTPKAE